MTHFSAEERRTAVRWVGVGVLAAGLAAGAPGCTDIVGVGKYHTAPGAAGAAGGDAASPTKGPHCGGYTYPYDAACGACMTDACCAALEACHADKLCDPWERCASQCAPDDFACHGACADQYGSHTNAAIGGVAVCEMYTCGDNDACAAADLGALFAGADCSKCLVRSCETQLKAFVASPGAEQISSCFWVNDLGREPTPVGFLTCGGSWAAPPSAELQQFDFCSGITCQKECKQGTHLNCVHEGYEYGFASTPTVKVHVTVLDNSFLLPGTPLEGINVRACLMDDVSCTRDWGHGKTDGDGNATFDLDVSQMNGRFSGYFELTDPSGNVSLYAVSYVIVAEARYVLVFESPATANTRPGEPTPGTGQINAGVFDCEGSPSLNSSFTTSGGALLTNPAAGQFVDGGAPTGLLPWIWVQDAPAGLVTLTGFIDGQQVAKYALPVRAGVVTYALLFPNPTI